MSLYNKILLSLIPINIILCLSKLYIIGNNPVLCKKNNECKKINSYIIVSFLCDLVFCISLCFYLGWINRCNFIYSKKILCYTYLCPIISYLWFIFLFSSEYNLVININEFNYLYIFQSIILTYYFISHIICLFETRIKNIYENYKRKKGMIQIQESNKDNKNNINLNNNIFIHEDTGYADL